jgi:putative flippase GtrA
MFIQVTDHQQIIPDRRTAAQFARFVGVGLVATGTQLLVLIALSRLRVCGPVAASSVGFALSAVVNYLLNFEFTFRSGQQHRVAAPRFAVVCTIGLIANAALMAILVHGLRVQAVAAQIVTICVVTAWNFIAHRSWTYEAA